MNQEITKRNSEIRGNKKSGALIKAAESGDEWLVKKLIRKGADVNFVERIELGYTALHFAAFNGHARIIERLLRAKADVNKVTADNYSALMLAALGGYEDAVKALLEEEPDLSIRTQDATHPHNGLTSLHLAVMSNNTEVVRLLMERGAEGTAVTDMGYNALHLAAELSSAAMVHAIVTLIPRLHLQCMFSIDSFETDCKYKRTAQGNSALHLAVGRGDSDIVTVLLQFDPSDVHLPDKEGFTSLHIAVYHQHTALVAQLLRYRMKVDSVCSEGRTPLIDATIAGNTEIVQLLLAHGADISTKDRDGKTAENYALDTERSSADWDQIRLLLRQQRSAVRDESQVESSDISVHTNSAGEGLIEPPQRDTITEPAPLTVPPLDTPRSLSSEEDWVEVSGGSDVEESAHSGSSSADILFGDMVVPGTSDSRSSSVDSVEYDIIHVETNPDVLSTPTTVHSIPTTATLMTTPPSTPDGSSAAVTFPDMVVPTATSPGAGTGTASTVYHCSGRAKGALNGKIKCTPPTPPAPPPLSHAVPGAVSFPDMVVPPATVDNNSSSGGGDPTVSTGPTTETSISIDVPKHATTTTTAPTDTTSDPITATPTHTADYLCRKEKRDIQCSCLVDRSNGGCVCGSCKVSTDTGTIDAATMQHYNSRCCSALCPAPEPIVSTAAHTTLFPDMVVHPSPPSSSSGGSESGAASGPTSTADSTPTSSTNSSASDLLIRVRDGEPVSCAHHPTYPATSEPLFLRNTASHTTVQCSTGTTDTTKNLSTNTPSQSTDATTDSASHQLTGRERRQQRRAARRAARHHNGDSSGSSNDSGGSYGACSGSDSAQCSGRRNLQRCGGRWKDSHRSVSSGGSGSESVVGANSSSEGSVRARKREARQRRRRELQLRRTESSVGSNSGIASSSAGSIHTGCCESSDVTIGRRSSRCRRHVHHHTVNVDRETADTVRDASTVSNTHSVHSTPSTPSEASHTTPTTNSNTDAVAGRALLALTTHYEAQMHALTQQFELRIATLQQQVHALQHSEDSGSILWDQEITFSRGTPTTPTTPSTPPRTGAVHTTPHTAQRAHHERMTSNEAVHDSTLLPPGTQLSDFDRTFLEGVSILLLLVTVALVVFIRVRLMR